MVFGRAFWWSLTLHGTPVSTRYARLAVTPLPRQLVSTCDVPALSALLTARLRAELPSLPISTSGHPVSTQDSAPSALHGQAVRSRVLSSADSVRSWRASRRPQSRAWTVWWTASLRPGPAHGPLSSGQRRKPKLDPPPLRGSPATPAHGRRVLTEPRRPAPPPAGPPPRPAPAPPAPDSLQLPRPRRASAAAPPPRGRTADWPAGGSSRWAPASAALSSDWWSPGGGRGERARMSKAKLCSSPAGGTVLRHAGRGLRTPELCAGWDLGKPRVLSLTPRFGTSGGLGLGRGFGTNGRTHPWAGLWNAGGPYVNLGRDFGKQAVSAYSLALASKAGRLWVGLGTTLSLRGCPDFDTLGHALRTDRPAPSCLPPIVPHLGIVEP